MAKDLIIVESPAKIKTIKKFLGDKYVIKASVGHVRDLPAKTLSVDEDNNFEPKYEVIEGKQKIVDELCLAASKARIVYLAPDPDREGEAIAWHIAELIKDKATEIKRIQFNEITAKAVQEALLNPRSINENLFDAQQARRILDRLVGYKISPLLWKNVKRGISAGRVQSVALRLIVEREELRRAFIAEEYWLFKAVFSSELPPPFKAELYKVGGKKPLIPDAKKAENLYASIKDEPFIIAEIKEKERLKAPLPPFITSTLQQAANQRLSYTAKRTMSIAQRLYEGVEIAGSGVTALITYMRTDSFRISDEAKNDAKDYILNTWGKEYLPAKPRFYKSKNSAQDAHEAIRPIDISLKPEMLKADLSPEQFNVYRLIWSRFLASQMANICIHDTVVNISCVNTLWRAKGERILFDGWLAAMARSAEESNIELPALKEGEVLKVDSLTKDQKFTQPLARYSEASLVKELEDKGIGRPSTYATIISTLQDREYVKLEDKHFIPTDLGSVVCEKLREHFNSVVAVDFTAKMEENLDKVAEGELNWVDLMTAFAADFNPVLEAAAKDMGTVKGGLLTEVICPECGEAMLIKFGRAGAFLACSSYPKCTSTTNFERDAQGKVFPVAREKQVLEVVGTCPLCEKDLVIKKARTGSRFIACTGYPKCSHTASFSTKVPCPKDGCNGTLVEKSSKRGKIFYACDQYPKCDYALWDHPLPIACPECDSPLLVRKINRNGERIVCPEKTCKYVHPSGSDDADA